MATLFVTLNLNNDIDNTINKADVYCKHESADIVK